MQNGATFNLNGRQYEILQAGVDFVEGQKACIRPKGSTRCISLEKAVKQGLVRTTGVASPFQPQPSEGGLFDIGHSEKNNATREDKRTTSPHQTPTINEAPKGTLFMPVDALRAQVFLAHGLIFPSLYDLNGMADGFNDVQTKFPADITLFRELPPLLKGQLILEVLVTPDEVADANKNKTAIHIQFPLPISRLSRILVPVQQSDLRTYIAGWVKPDVPAPAHLFDTIPNVQIQSLSSETMRADEKGAKPQKSIADSVARYDRLLGLFAFLRNAHRYISAATGFYSDYPDEYFNMAACLFDSVKDFPQSQSRPKPLACALLNPDTEIDPELRNLFELINSNDSFIDKAKARVAAKTIYERAGMPDDLARAFKCLFDGDYRSAVRILQEKQTPPEASILAGLFKFSNRQSNDHRNVKQRLHEEWADANMISQLMQVLGYYYGYTALDASEKQLYSVDPSIAPLVDPIPPIKFLLSTRLERSLIEAVYQWTFFRHKLNATHAALFVDVPVPSTQAITAPKGILVKDRSFQVGDLCIRRFEITLLARLLQRLRTLPGEVIDERSEVGRYLFRDCFDLADDSEVLKKRGAVSRRYRMSKTRLCELVAEQRISVNPRVLDVCIAEDDKNTRQ